MTKDHFYCIVVGFIFCAVLNTMPFADAEKYRKAVRECDKALPRDQHRKVAGVPE